MTRQEKLAFIRAKCIETIPEIVELKFGCQLLAPWGRPVTIWDVIPTGHACENKYLSEGIHYFYDSHRKGEFLHENSTQDAYKIIGRPITLADIIWLLCNGKNEEIDYAQDYGVMDVLNKWNLLKTLEDQAPETIDFIYEILK